MAPPSDSHVPAGAGGQVSNEPDPVSAGRDYRVDYRVIQEIGRGGQGIVYLAEDKQRGRKVALKVLREVGEENLGRLRREVEAAARLNHPGICTVLEAVLDGDHPYIAMRYIEGRSLAQSIATAQQAKDETWIARPDAPDEARPRTGAGVDTERFPSGPSNPDEINRLLEVIEKSARALHVAHEAKIIHRDVKPSNIMITGENEPVILDFGLAQLDESSLPGLTRTGEIWGTPAYLSPEQLIPKSKIDARTDIWSLGVTLFEALTLRRPFDGATNNQIFHSIQAKDPPDVCRVNRALPPDLRVVVETALEKDRDRRYQTAQAFADDLRAIREKRPIAARPVGPITRVTRWGRRNPALASSLLLAFFLLTAGLVVAVGLLLARNTALHEKEQALRQKTAALGDKEAALKTSEGTRLLAESSSALARDPGLALLLAIEGAKLAPEKATLVNGSVNEALSELREIRTLSGHLGAVGDAEFSPDERQVVTTAGDGVVRVWDLSTGATVASFEHKSSLRAAFAPKGTSLVSFATDGSCHIWDTSNWKERDLPKAAALLLSPDASQLLMCGEGGEISVWSTETAQKKVALVEPISGGPSYVGFSPDGNRILTVAQDGTVSVWASDTGARIARLPRVLPEIRLTRFSPDGHRVFAIAKDQGLIWNVDSGATVALSDPPPAGQVARINDASFNADGSLLLTLTRDSIHLWSTDKGEPRLLCGPQPDGEVQHGVPPPKALFTNDGKRVVGASCDGTAHVWVAETGEEDKILSGNTGDIREVSVSPPGAVVPVVLTTSSSGTLTLWDSATWAQLAMLRGHSGEVGHVSFTRDGSMLVTAGEDRTARVWNARIAFGAPVLEGLVERHQGPVTDVRFSADGKLMLTASSDGRPRVWSAKTYEEMSRLRGPKALSSPDFSPDGTRIIALCEDGTALLFESLTGTLLAALRGDSGFCQATFALDGSRIVTAAADGTAHVWDSRTGTEIVRLRGHEGPVNFVGFCARGARIVTASEDRTVRIWDPATATEVVPPIPGREREPPVVSPDGDRIVVTTIDGEAGIYDALSGAELARLPGNRHSAPMFSPNGKRLTTECFDGVFRIWDPRTGAEIASLPLEEGARLHTFSPDSRRILTIAKNGRAQLWDVDTGRRIANVPGQAGAAVTEAHFSPDGRWIVISSSDETKVFDALTASVSWIMTRRHGSVKSVQFSPDGAWLLAGYGGGLARLWPSDPIAKAPALRPRDLTFQELQDHNVDDPLLRKEVTRLFEDALTTEELVATLGRRPDLSEPLRKAAVTAALNQDPHVVAEKLRRRSWATVLSRTAPPEQYSMALKWIEAALAQPGGVDSGLTTLGAAYYRTGMYREALDKLEKALLATPEGDRSYTRAINTIFIAMSHAKLGETAEAASALAAAHHALETGGLRPPEDIRELLSEADALIASVVKKP